MNFCGVAGLKPYGLKTYTILKFLCWNFSPKCNCISKGWGFDGDWVMKAELLWIQLLSLKSKQPFSECEDTGRRHHLWIVKKISLDTKCTGILCFVYPQEMWSCQQRWREQTPPWQWVQWQRELRGFHSSFLVSLPFYLPPWSDGWTKNMITRCQFSTLQLSELWKSMCLYIYIFLCVALSSSVKKKS